MEEIIEENKIQANVDNNNNVNKNQIKFNLNNKYDNALLEELNNSKTKSWRIDIINATQDGKIDNKKDKIKLNEQKENDVINNNDKEDRFKDFDEILFLEENKDKKRKNPSIEKLGNMQKPPEKINSSEKKLIQENINNNNKNTSTISELNECIENNNNNSKDFENKKNIMNNRSKNLYIINQGKSSILSNIINNTNEKNDNKSKNINFEYSEELKSNEEKEDINTIKNNIEVIKDEKNALNNLYNNFISLFDKKNENKKDINNINRNLFGKNNSRSENFVNNKINPQLKISKSCNIIKNKKSKNIFNEYNCVIPNKSENIRKSLIYGKNTINIQLSIKRKTKSAEDIKRHMSYYLMEGNIKNPKSEINNFSHFINKYTSKRNYNSNSLNSFLSLQISSNQIIPKNKFKHINSQYNIFKNSFKDKIEKKMNNINNINPNKNFKSYRIKNKNNYINLEFFEESKQDNFFGKASNNDLHITKNKLLFENQIKKSVRENNFFKTKNNREDNTLFPISKINQIKNNNINNYLFKSSGANTNYNKKIFSFNYNEHKTSDFFLEKNEIFGSRFNYNTSKRKKLELEYNNTNLFKSTKNIVYPKRRNCQSLTSIFQNRLNNGNSSTYSYLYNNNFSYTNRNNRSNFIRRQTNIFPSGIYI